MTAYPQLDQVAHAAGIDRIGIAATHPVPDSVTDSYARWLADGNNAGMDYLDRYPDIRRDPELLLPGARSVVTCAVSYYHTAAQPAGTPLIAMYAHGDDYHDVMRDMMRPVADYIAETYSAETRICVDTAPVHERYWAVASGLGFRGLNGLVIVPQLGSYCFLGEIFTTAVLEPTEPLPQDTCTKCMRCVRACPGHALNGRSTLDARRCISYLTIEHRGDLPDDLHTGGRMYGCDTCQRVCPHNADVPEMGHSRFDLRPEYAALTVESINSMTPETYAATFRRSAIKRARLDGLKRNIRHL